ncbi:hypothetical protein [Convivina praedatoris]|uniref:ABC-2 type transporter n=1 Tax=Convivina praedatoris TaxID=2880963 RepID=A0ABM9D1Q7_9LACO|nr:hypothetical protein [Convivina sp. LMG 32447]CAH1851868.1 hypothetical protein LMG032447_00427 [Convivina sp. LMG 32447]CAH1851901.1 hypothetical protein R078138_00437 [Convivina sp. LMG 32447]CAH1852992.1 hypothetical protein R077815_00680 [Convivina sp. LMG 32447]
MIKYIDLKNTLRNKRFILFTLLVPSFWYVFMVFSAHSGGYWSQKYAYIWYMASALIGILGNSIVTFAKKISASKRFFLLQLHISDYSFGRWIKDQLFTQIILNTLIQLVILVVGLLMGAIKIDLVVIVGLLLVIVLGIYFSIIGFLLGIYVDSKTLDTIGTPIMMVLAMVVVPFHTFMSGTLADVITYFQQLFPGYYVYQIILKMLIHQSVGVDYLGLILTFGIIILPVLLVSWRGKLKEAR